MAIIILEKMVRKEDRVELLLRVNLDSKALKLNDIGDRESWKSKLAEILDVRFLANPGGMKSFSLGTIRVRL